MPSEWSSGRWLLRDGRLWQLQPKPLSETFEASRGWHRLCFVRYPCMDVCLLTASYPLTLWPAGASRELRAFLTFFEMEIEEQIPKLIKEPFPHRILGFAGHTTICSSAGGRFATLALQRFGAQPALEAKRPMRQAVQRTERPALPGRPGLGIGACRCKHDECEYSMSSSLPV